MLIFEICFVDSFQLQAPIAPKTVLNDSNVEDQCDDITDHFYILLVENQTEDRKRKGPNGSKL